MKVALIGLPGCGKTINSAIIARMFWCMHVNVNEMVYAYWAEHGLVAFDKVGEEVNRAVGKNTKCIIDGYPNSMEEYERLDFELDAIVYIAMLGHDEILRRLMERDGYDAQLLTSRNIDVFYKDTLNMIKELDARGKVVQVSGEHGVGGVLGPIVVGLSKKGILEADNYVTKVLKQMKNDYPENV